jgi:16S rRNA (adenine1518-N6/adenine1519-N6)-dimethyltransferase
VNCNPRRFIPDLNPVLHWSLPRRLGQHFLTRQDVLEKLAAAACGEHTHRVIEIGPGKGALTRRLLLRTDELHAIELDDRLFAYVNQQFGADSRFHAHHGDVLATDLSQWGEAVVAGNLPYYITSPIIEKFVLLDSRFPSAMFLMQREVADRIAAAPGSRDYGFLSVQTQLFCAVEHVCDVPPSAFSPPPKVDSSAIKLIRRANPPDNVHALLKFVGRCFAHKRKTLRNNLRPFYDQKVVDELPESSFRAEQLTISQLLDLHHRLSANPPH